jgi:hypothetical protein
MLWDTRKAAFDSLLEFSPAMRAKHHIVKLASGKWTRTLGPPGETKDALGRIFGRASDQGHDASGGLIGSLSFNPRNATQAHNIVVGKNERVDFNDASYGDFARSGAWKGVSSFGQDVLGGHITFFDIQPPDAFEIAEETADKAAARRHAARRR